MRVGFVTGSKMFPAARQKAEVQAAGVGRLYEVSGGESVEDVMQGIRNGNTLVIAGLYALGSKRADVLHVLGELAKKRITVERARDGRKADAGTAEWIIEDLAAIAGEARVKSRENASEQGKLGGRPKTKIGMTKREALAIWKRKDFKAVEKAAMIGKSIRQCYRDYDETGRPRGGRLKT